jgi:hypothetical protein
VLEMLERFEKARAEMRAQQKAQRPKVERDW